MADNPTSEKKESKDELYFGKYKTREEAERGIANMVGEFNRLKTMLGETQSRAATLEATNAALQAAAQTQHARQAETPIELTDDEGKLNADALMRAIELQTRPLREAMTKVPDLVNESVAKLLQPVSAAKAARDQFFGREDVDPRFTDTEFQAGLRANPAISAAFDKLVADPATSDKAYELVYGIWKDNRKVEKKSAINQTEKEAAVEHDRTGGPPAETGQPAEIEQMKELASRSQDLQSPEAMMDFARKWIKGSKIEADIGQPPDWWEGAP